MYNFLEIRVIRVSCSLPLWGSLEGVVPPPLGELGGGSLSLHFSRLQILLALCYILLCQRLVL